MTQPAATDREFTYTERDFRRICRLIHEHAGIALAPSKRDMVYSRLARRLRALGMAAFDAYLDHLESAGDAEEWQAFTNALTTNLTAFFREPHHFDLLTRHLRAQTRRPILLWSCAASTGEEPYSIAIAACEAFDSMTPPVRILATDVDTQVLATASAGIYPIERLERVGDERRRRFFLRGTGPYAGQCRVHPALQQLITFRPLNLLDAGYGLRGPFAAVFCRNVMIYFDKPTQYAILERIHPLLARDGLFFAGHSESFFHATDLFRACGQTVNRRADAVEDAA